MLMTISTIRWNLQFNGDDGIDGHPVGLFSNHSGEGDYEVEKFLVQKRIIHFLGERIDAQNRMNVQICILIKAGTCCE